MFNRLSLRVRIFLFFCLLAFGGIALAAGALAMGWIRAEDAPRDPFVTAFVTFLFLNTGLVAAIWVLFDKNVAKPIMKISTDLRLRAHSGIDSKLDAEAAKYLGDLAPAANAISETLNSRMVDNAADVARETGRLQAETDRLTAMLTQIPMATIVLNSACEVVLYDGQAAAVLSQFGEPRLRAPLSDYFDDDAITAIQYAMDENQPHAMLKLELSKNRSAVGAQLTALDSGSYMLTMDPGSVRQTENASRPLIYDFSLLEMDNSTASYESKLSELCFVAFDTETTGLSVEADSVVQLAAVRIVNGRIVSGEKINTYVNPERSIPPGSTRIHNISDEDVAEAPKFVTVASNFHAFARDAVLVAHNAPFDIAFLKRDEVRMGIAWDHPVLDTVLLSAIIFGITEEHSLDALCERLHVEIKPEVRHTALGDAQATGEALVKMLPLLEARGFDTLGKTIAEAKKFGQLLKDIN